MAGWTIWTKIKKIENRPNIEICFFCTRICNKESKYEARFKINQSYSKNIYSQGLSCLFLILVSDGLRFFKHISNAIE
jgi:hypothetical protein